MKKLSTIAVTILVVMALIGAYRQVRAQENRRPYGPPGATLRVSTPTVLTAHTLITSYFNYGDDASTGSGYQPVDSAFNSNCTSVTGCTIELDSWVDVGGGTSGDLYGICLFVDGVQAPDCPYIGYLPSDASFVTGSGSQTVAVGPGTHTLQTFVYTTGSGEIAFYHNSYHLYRP